MSHPSSRADATRTAWKSVLATHHEDRGAPVSADYWSDKDTWSRDRIRAVQDEKIAAVAPFLYENSAFYRRRFDRLGVAPTDLNSVETMLANWPVVTKHEMMEDATAHPPYGTYTTCGTAEWGDRGWMLFSSSGSTVCRASSATPISTANTGNRPTRVRSIRAGCARATAACR